MADKSIQVVVRVRPFNQREKDMGTPLCVKMEGNKTILFNPSNPEDKREFSYDHSFWSHDGFRTDGTGLMVPVEDYYADQQLVYQQLGEGLLDNAWQGYHCTLFAYGQTGSGKSYSVMGYPPNLGIVPITCQRMFERIHNDDNTQYEVTFSMMEIYNEKVQDLFISTNKRPQNGMKIRESPSLGFYAEGLKKYPVKSYNEIEQKMEEGQKNRSIAATQMNATSSRAHTIVLIELKMKNQSGGKITQKYSAMNLVDLAGSEKVEKTGATGDRLKEASAINKSLSMLGLVISTLADHAIGKTNRKIPYRDSCLTKLLKNALGGNSKTIMICAISPAYDNYEETLSTLRYADQAKKIKNKAIVNESASDKLIRELRAENGKLNDKIADLQKKIESGSLSQKEQKAEFNELLDIKENMEQNQKLIEDQDKTEEQKRQELEDQDQEEEGQDNQKIQSIDQSKPYITNINEDPQLCGQVQKQVSDKPLIIGRKNKDESQEQPDLILNGIGIRENHCKIVEENGAMFLIPGDDLTIPNNLYVNGDKVSEKYELKNNDRVIIGQTITFLAKVPGGQPRNPDVTEDHLDYEYAQEEKVQKQVKEKQQAEKEMEMAMQTEMQAKIKALEEKHQRQIEEFESKALQQQQIVNQLEQSKFQKQQSRIAGETTDDVEDPLKKSIVPAEQLEVVDEQQEIDRQEDLKKQWEQEKQEQEKRFQQEKAMLIVEKATIKFKAAAEKKKLERQLADIEPKVAEMNQVSKEFGRDIKFGIQVKPEEEDPVKVNVNNKENNTRYTWDKEKAINRYYRMMDQLDIYNQYGDDPDGKNTHQDPFWDFADPANCGRGHFRLQPILYRQEIPMQIMLYDKDEIQCVGLLKVHLYETDPEGIEPVANQYRDKPVQDPNNLLGKRMYLKICINSVKLPPNAYNIQVEYKFFGRTYKTDIITDRNNDSQYVFDYSKIHQFQKVDDYVLSTLAKQNIHFVVFGQIDPNQQASFIGKKDETLTYIHQDQSGVVSYNGTGFTKDNVAFSFWVKNKGKSIVLFACLSWILFFIQTVISGNYREQYDKMDQDEEDIFNIRSNGNTEEHDGYWRAFSIMMVTSIIMMTYYPLNFLATKIFMNYTIEFIQLQIIPFMVWFISSIAFLTVDQDFQDRQNDFANNDQSGESCNENSEIYKRFEHACDFSKRYQVLHDLTIYMVVFGTILFSIYYFGTYKYLSAIKQVELNKKKIVDSQKVENQIQQQRIQSKEEFIIQ